MNTLNDIKKISDAFPASEKMPVLFLGHGSPMNGIEENQFTKGFQNISKTLQKPKAIICVSAHWFTRGTKVTAMEMPKTIHDFGGFPQELYEQQYPAKGNPKLAKETKKLLHPALVELDEKWGLDHGAWTVLKHLFPKADIPVIQLSIDYTKDAQYHFELAKQLNSLRDKGVLIIGSGNIIHNLRLVDWPNFNKENHGYDWAIEVRETINNYLIDGNFNPLINYEKQSKAFQLAIPSPDHYLPLIYSLGLKNDKENITLFNDNLMAGSLSMTSLKIS
ncbi:4,5-DOPA dioxygenase extradiol [Lutibacter sp. B1]|uniref:4,5-DOPA-extradiol-dioxygenase n=1 Tax=Lutibacter sp. B1 TaxID=2725996 RepID=UPI0014576FF0|nr:4,5-DOPA dioxygenase extradiol [Lutibacter sp. B1]NLP59253.1 4,5-DOPA dioxygenase extradiol [Lutibacter sp. B1]